MPWDQKQTFQTLRHLTIEELYELADALLEEDLEEIKKELGDLLLHIFFSLKVQRENYGILLYLLLVYLIGFHFFGYSGASSLL